MAGLTQREIASRLEFALDLSYRAGRFTLGYFQAGVQAERKPDNTPVTAADKGAERMIREAIESAFPDDGMIGEEYGRLREDSALQWIIDPIDGTKSFIHGVPLYGCLLALVDRLAPPSDAGLVGVAHFPAVGDTIYASQGTGCYWNGRRAHVSGTTALEDATLLFSDVVGYGDRRPAFEQLIARTYIQRTWGDSYGYSLIATGRADVMLDPIMNVWDCAPFGVILREAGGTFTDWSGTETIFARESIATNGLLLNAVLDITASTSP